MIVPSFEGFNAAITSYNNNSGISTGSSNNKNNNNNDYTANNNGIIIGVGSWHFHKLMHAC